MLRALLVVVAVSGCGYARVDLRQAVGLPVDELERDWRITGVVRERSVLQVDRHVTSKVHSDEFHSVVLANGTQVEDPRDLVPLLTPNSQTERLAQEWSSGLSKWAIVGGSALGAVVGGVTLIFVGGSPSASFGGIALAVVGPIVSFILGRALIGDVEPLRLKAFRSYDDDLTLGRSQQR